MSFITFELVLGFEWTPNYSNLKTNEMAKKISFECIRKNFEYIRIKTNENWHIRIFLHSSHSNAVEFRIIRMYSNLKSDILIS